MGGLSANHEAGVEYGLFAVVGYLIVVFAVALALDAPEIAAVVSAVVLGVAVTFWLLRER